MIISNSWADMTARGTTPPTLNYTLGLMTTNGNGSYMSLRIPADPLSVVKVKVMAKGTGTTPDVGIAIAYPTFATVKTSDRVDVSDWQLLELSYNVPLDNVTGYVDIQIGSFGVATGDGEFYAPIIEVHKSKRVVSSLSACGMIIIDNGAISIPANLHNTGIISATLDAGSLWVNIELDRIYALTGVLPLSFAQLDPNTATASAVGTRIGNWSGANSNIVQLYIVDSASAVLNLNSVVARVNVSFLSF